MTALTTADFPLLQLQLPSRLLADDVLREGLYILRIFAGLGAEGAADAASGMRDFRLLLTSATGGSVSAARGAASAWGGGAVPGLQNTAMLLYHPLELCRLLSRTADRFAPGLSPTAPLGLSARSVAASLWLMWIVCTTVLSVRQLRGASDAGQRRALKMRLSKLALDLPLATHFLLGASLLPLVAVGVLGAASSFCSIRGMLADPQQQGSAPRISLPVPMGFSSPRSLKWDWGALDWGGAEAARAVGSRVTFAAPCRLGLRGTRQPAGSKWVGRRRIQAGALSTSCEW